MSIASDPAPLPPRKRRWPRVLVGLALIAALGGGVYAARESLETCGRLDILLKRSGCVSTMTLKAFEPMVRETMVVSRKTGRLSVFGLAKTPEGWRTGLAEVDLAHQRERARRPLPMQEVSLGRMRAAPDGSFAVLFCDRLGRCAEGGGEALSVPIDAPEDARPLNGPEAVAFRPAPPGVADFPVTVPYGSIVLPDGQRIASVDDKTNDIVLRRVGDGAETARMSVQQTARLSLFSRELVASPNGRMIALVTWTNPVRLKVGVLIRLFDVAKGRLVATIATDESFAGRATAAFTLDESAIVLARRLKNPVATELATFAIPETETKP